MWSAIEACASVLPHISNDDVTPVITCASISGDKITATDRYTVAQHSLAVGLAEGSILLPRAAVAWIARIVTKNLLEHPVAGGYTVTITAPDPDIYAGLKSDMDQPGQTAADLSDGVIQRSEALDRFNQAMVSVTVECEARGVESMRAFRPVAGTHPPVARLFDEFKPLTEGDAAIVHLGPSQLEKFTTWARKWHRERPLKFELSKSEGNKPGPVRVTIDNFRGLIQPNIPLR